MYREIFTKFLKDLSKFNPNELIIVTYSKPEHLLIFRQVNHIVIAPYLSPFFFPKSGFKIGVLTQSGYNKLIYNLNQLLGTSLLDEEKLIPDIGILGLDWYRYYGNRRLPIPQKFISLKFVNVSSRLLTWLLCKFYNNNSRIIYNLVTNERKLTYERERSKSSESESITSTASKTDSSI